MEKITGVNAPEKQVSLALELPGDLQDWASRNEPMISRLSRSISKVSEPLSETAAWDLIAGHFSDEWSGKKSELSRTEQRLAHLMAPENAPLGLVGAALHSDETNHAVKEHTLALADFTIVNETLRQQEELHKLLGAVLRYNDTVTKSLTVSQDTAKVTNALDAALETPKAASAFTKAAGQQPESRFAQSFKTIATKFLSRPASETAAEVKAPKPKAKTPALTV